MAPRPASLPLLPLASSPLESAFLALSVRSTTRSRPKWMRCSSPVSERQRVRRGLRPWQADLRARSPSPAPAAVIKHKRRIEEIKELIDGKRTGRTKGSSEQQAVKNKLAELRGQFQALVVSWPACASAGHMAAWRRQQRQQQAHCRPCPCPCLLRRSNAADHAAGMQWYIMGAGRSSLRCTCTCTSQPPPPRDTRPLPACLPACLPAPCRRARRRSCAPSWMWLPRRGRAPAPP